MKVLVLDEAVADLAAGFRFYQRQADGLGDYFLDTLWADIQALQIYAGIHSRHFGYFRLLSKRFPFAVYYKVEAGIVRVYAVLDWRKNPGLIVSRLE
ncbi:MAG: hypothetical protein RBR43_06910 [Desulfuromonadaceae bacterium]|nr:hypothetical protein [Desulfuromonadaceae bacterium]